MMNARPTSRLILVSRVMGDSLWELRVVSCELRAMALAFCSQLATRNSQLHHFSITRLFAERVRVLRASSSGEGVRGFLVRTLKAPVCSSDRNACLTDRSSIDWKLITANFLPAGSAFGA